MERTKELKCIYDVEELLSNYETPVEEICQQLVLLIPQAWQYSEFCKAKIDLYGKSYSSADFYETDCKIVADIYSKENPVGKIEIVYAKEGTSPDSCPFLVEELQLLKSLARKIGDHFQHREFRAIVQGLQKTDTDKDKESPGKWRTVVELLYHTDRKLYSKMARKFLNYLCLNGIQEANSIFPGRYRRNGVSLYEEDENQPQQKDVEPELLDKCEEIYNLAERHLPEETILAYLKRWIQDDKITFLVKTLINLDSSLEDSAEAVRRFIDLSPPYGPEMTDPKRKEIRVLLTRRFITNQMEYVNAAKKNLRVRDFYNLLDRIIIPSKSHGVIGGKAAGIFLAGRILENKSEKYPRLKEVAVPKTWYLPSDGVNHFITYNNMEDLFELKYKPLEEIRLEYPHIIQLFKNSQFPPDIVQGLSMALDDLGQKPIIVRSSSRLEDRFGSAFSGKYKSLFLGNQGSKKERLESLLDAVAEVYSSINGPDPLEYRAERGLLDVREEMGVIIQEVVGTKVGPYFLPTFAGLALSSNEFRWSPRIKREDGLIRLVPGLGTRAVDRLSDDYPTLLSPGQPDLRVNTSPDEIARYSPAKMDVINLENNCLETIEVKDFIKEYADDYPDLEKVVSLFQEERLRRINRFTMNFKEGDPVVTFEGLIEDDGFIPLIKNILAVLQEELKSSVDIEFAWDGKKLYLLQCRPQSSFSDYTPSPIPRNIPFQDIIFTARRHISNGKVPSITHLVYVDPEKYAALETQESYLKIGSLISRLNKLLPKRGFILIGPGRWGSRGDIKLGVRVTYSDINNTSVLIEMAKRKGNYCPDLSFGTHFFQDLVESSIRYLPLYPDDSDVIFNFRFINESPNILKDILPEYEQYQEVVKVIDIPKVTQGRILRLLLNADQDEALAYLTFPSSVKAAEVSSFSKPLSDPNIPNIPGNDASNREPHWEWRNAMALRIAQELERETFGVKDVYLIGSTKNATAGPSSDIDLIIHFQGTALQRKALLLWLEGWSQCLDEFNFLKTGRRSGGLLDIHIVTDKDIKEKSSFAVKIGAVTDPAERLPVGKKEK